MDFTSYLAFIQVAIAFNFGSVYWREKEKKDNSEKNCIDAIAQMYRNESLKDLNLKDKSDNWLASINRMKKVLLEENKCSDVDKRSFYSICDKHQKTCTQMLNLNNRIGGYSCSVCFSCICLFLGLYGLMQLCLFPDINHSEFIRYVYLYFTEILLYMIAIFIFIDGYCWFKWIEKNDYYYKLTVGIFLGVFILGCTFAWLTRSEIFKPGLLPCSENTFIYMSIYLTYISYIVYFILNLMEYCRELYLAKYKIPKMSEKCNLMVQELERICAKF